MATPVVGMMNASCCARIAPSNAYARRMQQDKSGMECALFKCGDFDIHAIRITLVLRALPDHE